MLVSIVTSENHIIDFNNFRTSLMHTEINLQQNPVLFTRGGGDFRFVHTFNIYRLFTEAVVASWRYRDKLVERYNLTETEDAEWAFLVDRSWQRPC